MEEKYINSKIIHQFFNFLNTEEISYALIKNVGDELPHKLRVGKDIDIIVKSDSVERFHLIMPQIARKIIHPLGKEMGWRNIYGLDDFEFWRLKTADDIFIDVTTKLCCHSLMPQIWLPLDNLIQKDLWNNKLFNKEKGWWQLDENILFTYLIIRCVFDKHKFTEIYTKEILIHRRNISTDIVMTYLKLEFFNFSETLLDLIDTCRFEDIIPSYLRFCKY